MREECLICGVNCTLLGCLCNDTELTDMGLRVLKEDIFKRLRSLRAGEGISRKQAYSILLGAALMVTEIERKRRP